MSFCLFVYTRLLLRFPMPSPPPTFRLLRLSWGESSYFVPHTHICTLLYNCKFYAIYHLTLYIPRPDINKSGQIRPILFPEVWEQVWQGRRRCTLWSLGVVSFLNNFLNTFLHKGFVPQVLKQVVNLSCYLFGFDFRPLHPASKLSLPHKLFVQKKS